MVRLLEINPPLCTKVGILTFFIAGTVHVKVLNTEFRNNFYAFNRYENGLDIEGGGVIIFADIVAVGNLTVAKSNGRSAGFWAGTRGRPASST